MRRLADVYAYDKSLKPIEGIPIVNGETSWDYPITGQMYILVINEALYCSTKLKHSLINPNQVRNFGIDFWDNPFDKDRGLNIEVYGKINITMCTCGTKVFFNSHLPTIQELQDFPKIQITSKGCSKLIRFTFFSHICRDNLVPMWNNFFLI